MKTDTGCDLKKKLFNQQNTFRPCSGIQTALVTIFAHLCKFQTKNRKRMINISRRNENKNVNAFSPSLCREHNKETWTEVDSFCHVFLHHIDIEITFLSSLYKNYTLQEIKQEKEDKKKDYGRLLTTHAAAGFSRFLSEQ